jgi:hypothetical protein
MAWPDAALTHVLYRATALCAVVLSTACEQVGRTSDVRDTGKLLGRTVISGIDELEIPRSLAVTPDYLMVGDNGDHVIKMYDRRTGSRLGIIGRDGEGPGEFRVIGTLQSYQRAGSAELWAFDYRQQRLTGFRVGDSAAVQLISPPFNGAGLAGRKSCYGPPTRCSPVRSLPLPDSPPSIGRRLGRQGGVRYHWSPGLCRSLWRIRYFSRASQ